MKCADPVLCYLDSKGKRIFRNFSFAVRTITGIPADHIVLDCGKCLTCRKKRAYELAARCVLHASLYKDNCFLTLTYDEKKDGYHNRFQYSDIQKFKKRLRSYCYRNYQKRIEVFNVHEYGKAGKKHWHLILFNFDFDDKIVHTVSEGINLYTSKRLSSLWPFGFNTLGDVSAASAMYTAQYIEKDFKNYNVANEKKSHSKHSGLGRPYFEKHYKQILSLGYIPFNGGKLPIPRYFQKLTHKNWAWFNDRSYFLDSEMRNKVYTPFSTDTDANLDLGNMWPMFKLLRDQRSLELATEWNDVILQYLTTKAEPDFIKSNSNSLYDLRNRRSQEKF